MMGNCFISIFGGIILLMAIGIIVFVILLTFSPKIRGKFMSNQVKSVKYMTDYAKKDIEDINTNVADAQVKSRKNVIDKNYDDLKDISSKSAEINKEAISMTTKAIKDGFNEDKKYCKWCGSLIDRDSNFCKDCGKKQ